MMAVTVTFRRVASARAAPRLFPAPTLVNTPTVPAGSCAQQETWQSVLIGVLQMADTPEGDPTSAAQARNGNSDDSETRHRRGAVYFDDGDIVLSVKDEEGHPVLYRVDMKFLSRHSPVFAGMFELPTPEGVNEEHDGVPVVHLEDNQKALEDLLSFIYNPV